MTRNHPVRWALLVLCCAVLALPTFGRTQTRQTFDTGELEVRNLIGQVKIEGHGGSQFEVDIDIQGKDASEGTISVESTDDTLSFVFPKASRFIYPRLGSGSKSSFNVNKSDSWLSEILGSLTGKNRVEVRGSGTGVELWVDLTIRVPAGSTLVMNHGVGELEASNVNGDLSLAIRSGHISADGVTGNLVADTGSGHVNVSKVRGDTTVDTGSGHVEARDIEGERIVIDTGSGHVELDGARASYLNIDTGSGRVEAKRISTDGAVIDTGSGSVTLELDEMGDGDFEIDTGSGSIRLRVPHDVSADVKADTGSGGIHLDLEGVKLQRKDRDEVAFTIGGGGARVRLDTGSGSITISH